VIFLATRTKTQKRNLVRDIRKKSRILFFEDLLTVKDLEALMKITEKAGKKLQ